MLLQIMHTIAVNSIVFRNWLNKIALRAVACTPEIDVGYTEYQAYCDGQANTTFASGITFGQPLSLYGQSGTYDIIEVFGLSVGFSGSVSIIDGTSDVCPHGWTEVHVPMSVRIGTGS